VARDWSRMLAHTSVVFNESKLAKPVHEEADPGSRRSDSCRQCILPDLWNNLFGSAFLPEVCQEQKYSRQSLLAGVEELINEIFLNSDISRKEMGDECLRKHRFFMKAAKELNSCSSPSSAPASICAPLVMPARRTDWRGLYGLPAV
jgi:hypothetical protein